MGWFGFLFLWEFLCCFVFFAVSLAREKLHKENILTGLCGKCCHLQIIKHFFPLFLNLQIIDPGFTKHYNCFYLSFDLVMSYLSVLGSDFSSLSFEFPLTHRAHAAEVIHMKRQCQK